MAAKGTKKPQEMRKNRTELPKTARKQPWVAETKSIPVYAINPWGVEYYFSSAREAARQLDIDQSKVTACLKGRRKTTGGYRWRYA